MSTQYTAFPSEQQEEIQHIIEHVNADHEPEMLLVMKAFTPYDYPIAVALENIFVEGCQFLVNHSDADQAATVFVPFTIDDEHIKPRIKGLVADARRHTEHPVEL